MRRPLVWLVLTAVAVSVAGPGLARAVTFSEEGTVSSDAMTAEAAAGPDVALAERMAATDLQPIEGAVLAPRTGYSKPPVTAHADEPPQEAWGLGVKGASALALADRRNTITFDRFASGDIVVALGTLTGHAGVFDGAYYSSLYSYAVWSANKTLWPIGRVMREQCAKYRDYPVAYGLWVPSKAGKRSAVRYYCRLQNGEPYDVTSSKRDQSRWYCSKLCWAGWRYAGGVDLDADGGYYVWPVDLLDDPATKVFGRWS